MWFMIMSYVSSSTITNNFVNMSFDSNRAMLRIIMMMLQSFNLSLALKIIHDVIWDGFILSQGMMVDKFSSSAVSFLYYILQA